MSKRLRKQKSIKQHFEDFDEKHGITKHFENFDKEHKITKNFKQFENNLSKPVHELFKFPKKTVRKFKKCRSKNTNRLLKGLPIINHCKKLLE